MSFTTDKIKTLQDRIAVMAAFEAGDPIEFRCTKRGTKWEDCPGPFWDWKDFDYRVKAVPREWWKMEGGIYTYTDSQKAKADATAISINGRPYTWVKVREVLED